MSITFIYKLLMSFMIIYLGLLILDLLHGLIRKEKILKITNDIEMIKKHEEERLQVSKDLKEELEKMNKINKHITLS